MMSVHFLLIALTLLTIQVLGTNLDNLDDLEDLGCWRDKWFNDRALPDLYENTRSNNDMWNNYPDLSLNIRECANYAKSKNYKCFGVQFWGECWGSETACDTYNKFGPANNCEKGVGMNWSNKVYSFKSTSAGRSAGNKCGPANSVAHCLPDKGGYCPGTQVALSTEFQTCREGKLCCIPKSHSVP